MATRIVLSGSTDGQPIVITDTATLGQAIHTAHASNVDQIWIWACNDTAAAVKLTIEWGDAAATIVGNVPAHETVLVVDGLRLSNSEVVTAFAASGSAINLIGHVNRLD